MRHPPCRGPQGHHKGLAVGDDIVGAEPSITRHLWRPGAHARSPTRSIATVAGAGAVFIVLLVYCSMRAPSVWPRA
eukprot:scaffold55932_cov30-Tisochrysis_lutea.AAC.5